MPYFTKGKCVYKKTTGKKVGCTKGPVEDYLAALHANVTESLEYKDINISKDENENPVQASVYYTSAEDPSIELELTFSLSPEADYVFGTFKDNKGETQRFEDPLEIKDTLQMYNLEPDDIVRRGEESYEFIEDELNRLKSTDGVSHESLTFNSLYNSLMLS